MSTKRMNRWYIEKWMKDQAASAASIPAAQVTLLILVCLAFCGVEGWLFIQSLKQGAQMGMGATVYYTVLVAFGGQGLFGVLVIVGCLAGVIYRLMPKKVEEPKPE